MGRKIALITGGTSGIGAAFAYNYAGQDYDLILTGHPDDKISSRIMDLKEKFPVNVEIIPADLAIEEDIIKIEEVISTNPMIDVLISNAGFVFWKHFWEKSSSDLERMIKVHISTPVRIIKAVLPGMIRKNTGTIITVSSISSFMPIPQDSMYSATKVFSNSFTEALHISLMDKGIKVQLLCPGFVNSNFHERAGVDKSKIQKSLLLKWMNPDEVVRISVRNLKRKNKVIVVPGFRNKLLRLIVTCTPRSLYYRFASVYLK